MHPSLHIGLALPCGVTSACRDCIGKGSKAICSSARLSERSSARIASKRDMLLAWLRLGLSIHQQQTTVAHGFEVYSAGEDAFFKYIETFGVALAYQNRKRSILQPH